MVNSVIELELIVNVGTSSNYSAQAVIMKIDLQLKYGVVRARGTLTHNIGHELVFQSNNGFEALNELKRLADLHEKEFTYMLIVKDDRGQERRQRTQERRTLQNRRQETRRAVIE